jgi:valyl-tRNA synthetase
MKLSDEKVAGFRNFANKLWNIARFVLSVIPSPAEGSPRRDSSASSAADFGRNDGQLTLADRWILARLAEVTQKVTTHLENHEFSAAGELLRDFTWADFADWYLEIAKIQKAKGAKVAKGAGGSTDEILLYVLENILVLWHPFMPFVTEEIWKQFGREGMMMVHAWPVLEGRDDEAAIHEFGIVREVIGTIRNLRALNKIEPAKKIEAVLVSADANELLEKQREIIGQLGRIEKLEVTASRKKPEGAAVSVTGGTMVIIPLAGLVDLEKEHSRLEQELASIQKYLETMRGKLANEEFVSKAPAKVVDEMKAKLAEAEKAALALAEQIKSL